MLPVWQPAGVTGDRQPLRERQVVKVVVAASLAVDALPAAGDDGDRGSLAACDLTGTWSTTFNEVQIQGQAGSYLGVWGALSEIGWTDGAPNTVAGRFRNGGRDGFFSWTFGDTADGCNSFTGQWGRGSADSAPVVGRWNGHRTSTSAPMAPPPPPPPALAPSPPAPPAAGPAASTSTSTSGVDGFAGPFVGMGISGFNDLGHTRAAGPAECARHCAALAACRSFDWGARGQVRGECWLSSADRQSAGHAYRAWQLYDYYEKAAEGSGMGSGSMADASSSGAVLLSAASTDAQHGGGGGGGGRVAGPSFTGEADQAAQLPEPLLLAVCFAVLGSGFLLMVWSCYTNYRHRQGQASSGDATLRTEDGPLVLVRAAAVPLHGEVVSLCPPSVSDEAQLEDGRGSGYGAYPAVLLAEEAKASDAAVPAGGGGGGSRGEDADEIAAVRMECSV
eukprot:SAG22_NODE_252_length_13679_cov_74.486524_5_plen_449_part_00